MKQATDDFVTWHRQTGLSRRVVLLLVALLFAALGLRMAALASVVLTPEEAYYWMYSQHPNLSYYDHPPMVAWVIGLGTWLFGNTEFGVRIVGTALMLATSGLMFWFGRLWFGRTAGLVAALSLQVLPIFFGIGFIATMDSALLFFWMLGLVGVSEALKRGRVWGWYVWGLGLGAGLLSKYTAVFLGVGTLLAVVAHRPWRQQLRSWHPYLASGLAVALFSPVIVWNAQHEWASFKFQFLERFEGHPFNVAGGSLFLGLQVAAVTPVVLALAGWACARAMRRPRRLRNGRWLIALSFSAPLFLVMAYKSFRYAIHLDWTAQLYLSLLPLCVWLVLLHTRALRGRVCRLTWATGFYGTILVCLALNVGVMFYLLTVQQRMNRISAFGQWRQLAKLIEEYEDRLEEQTGKEPLIVGDGKYRLASILAFYRTPLETDVKPSQFTTSQWMFEGKGLGFPYWTQRNLWAGADCIYVDGDTDKDIFRVSEHFDSVEFVKDPRLSLLGYQVLVCRGFRN